MKVAKDLWAGLATEGPFFNGTQILNCHLLTFLPDSAGKQYLHNEGKGKRKKINEINFTFRYDTRNIRGAELQAVAKKCAEKVRAEKAN